MIFEGDWFFWAVVSTLLLGLHSVGYSKLIEARADVLTTQIVLAASVSVYSAVALVGFGQADVAEQLGPFILISALQGALYFASTTARLDALKNGVPPHVLFPLLKLSGPLVVLVSVIVFQETTFLTSPRNIVGMVLTLGATWVLVQLRPGQGQARPEVGFALLAMLFSAGAILASRYVYSEAVDIFAFMLLSNVVQVLLATAYLAATGRKVDEESFRNGIKSGLVLGLLSFGGFASFLLAIRYGDLSRVAAINTLYVLIPIIFATTVRGAITTDRFSFRKQLAVVLSLVGALLLR